jgi:hypothetical protein
VFLLPAATAAGLAAGSCAPAPRPAAPPPPPPETPHDAVVRIAARIRKADFEGDRERLTALFQEMEPFTEGPLASRARYWRGFALWRRASNGFNDGVPNAELVEDLNGAIAEFQQSLSLDPAFVDAKIGEAGCVGSLAPASPTSERPQLLRRQWSLLLEAQKEAPENPRLAWVLGTAKWSAPAKQGGGQDQAFQTYREGLALARKQAVSDAADPAWGEAELLMSLAWACLNAKTPNLDAANHYSHAALNLAPDWRYVRDILMPQIEAARTAPTPTPAPKRSKTPAPKAQP